MAGLSGAIFLLPTMLAELSTTHVCTHPPCQLYFQSPISLVPYSVGCTDRHVFHYSPTLEAAPSATHLCTPPPCQPNCQAPKPTLLVALLITHPLNPVSCQLHRQSHISLLTHPGSQTVRRYLFTPYRVSRTVNHSCLYSPTLSAVLSVTHLSSPLLCQLH